MVVRRTIEHMKTRPREDRVAFAGAIAIGVMFVLFIGWAIFFFGTIDQAIPQSPATATSTAESF